MGYGLTGQVIVGEKTNTGGWKVDSSCYLTGKHLVKLSPSVILEASHAPN